MGAWTTEERIELIGLLTHKLYTQGKIPGLPQYRVYECLVRQLATACPEFLELNRRNFADVITQYNAEKPDKKPVI